MRVVEHYTSVQGEGKNVGLPTQFVRFAGCNFKCPGWPCDSSHAIDPKLYRPLQKNVTPADIIATAFLQPANNICLTGGEPMMQPQVDLLELAGTFIDEGYSVEMFSNGSFLYSASLLALADIVMDWKLSGSGEGDNFVPNRIINLEKMARESSVGRHSVKFVCADRADLDEALEVVNLHSLNEYGVNIYFGVAWGRMKEADLVEQLLGKNLPYDWRLNVQVHNHIWPVNERGR